MWTTQRFPAIWLLPALLPVALMTIYPIAYALWTSMHSVLLLFPDTPFTGIDNYVRVVKSGYFLDALYNSLLFTAIAAPLVVVFGTLTALFL
ncbi:MAG: sugar ABC transporter permease, partial [Mesorhizobium sp.]